MALPIGWLEIVLNVEQPHARTAAHQQNGNFNQQISLPANVIDRPADKSQQGDIRPDDAILLAFARAFIPKAIGEDKDN